MFENYDSVIRQMQALGLLVTHPEIDTPKPVRCAVDLNLCPVDRMKARKAGWYHLATVTINGRAYIVGAYGFWKGVYNNKIKIELEDDLKNSMTDEQKKAISERMKKMETAAKKARQEEIEEAAKRALWIWSKYVPHGESDYLTRKGVKPHGVRFDPKGKGTMAVPMTDVRGKIYGLQLIRSDSAVRGTKKIQKKFEPKGLAVSGHFHLIGHRPNEVVLIAEGYATAATVYEAVGLPVAVAFNANNLKPVAENLRKAYPDARIIICADDDYKTDGNPGVTKAEEAANAVGGRIVTPNFKDENGHDIRNEQKLTDFNDLAMHPQGGSHLVRAQIEAALQGISFKPKEATVAREPSGGSGGKNRPAAVSEMSLDDLVKRFLFIDDDTGDFVYDSWTKKIVKFSKMKGLLQAKMKPEDIKQHPVWVNKAVYIDQIGFDPTEKDPDVLCNTWEGWPTQPNPQSTSKDCQRLVQLLGYLCSTEGNHPAIVEWLLKWMAYPIQNPGAKMQTAVVMHGPQGTGKSMFWESYAKIYGEYGLVINQGAMEDKFNSDWADKKLFVVADEIVAKSEMHHIKNTLKGMITGETIRINPKNMPARTEKNRINFVFLSNEHQPVVLEPDDRRHCVIWTPKQLDKSFYNLVDEELANGGVEAFHQMLLTLDLTGFAPHTQPPMTQAKKELIDINLDTPRAFMNDYINGELNVPIGPVRSSDFYKLYLEWCHSMGEKFPRPQKQFIPHVKGQGWFAGHKRAYDSYHWTNLKRVRVIIPSEEALLTAQEKGLEVVKKPEDYTETQWITAGILEFNKARNPNYVNENAPY